MQTISEQIHSRGRAVRRIGKLQSLDCRPQMTCEWVNYIYVRLKRRNHIRVVSRKHPVVPRSYAGGRVEHSLLARIRDLDGRDDRRG